MADSDVTLDLAEARRKIQQEKPARRRELLEGMVSQGGEEVDRLIMSFMDDASADVRRTVVGLMRRRGFENREFYSRASEDPSAIVKRTALAAIGSLDRLRERQRSLSDHLFRRVQSATDRSREEGYFSRALQNPDKNIRMEAIRRLGEIDAPWVLDTLLEGLRDESWTNRTAIVKILGLRAELPPEPLLERLRDRLWYIRSTAVEILGFRREAAAVSKMAHLVKDTNVEVRTALADALGRIGGPEAARLLELLTSDPNYSVRVTAEKAVKALRRHGQERP